jgi:hypothetical protein
MMLTVIRVVLVLGGLVHASTSHADDIFSLQCSFGWWYSGPTIDRSGSAVTNFTFDLGKKKYFSKNISCTVDDVRTERFGDFCNDSRGEIGVSERYIYIPAPGDAISISRSTAEFDGSFTTPSGRLNRGYKGSCKQIPLIPFPTPPTRLF